MSKRWMLAGLIFLAGCGSTGQPPSVGGPAQSAGQILARSSEPHFAVIEGDLTDSPSATHRLRLDPSLFDLPRGQVVLRVTLEHERDHKVQLSTSKGLTVSESMEGLVFTQCQGLGNADDLSDQIPAQALRPGRGLGWRRRLALHLDQPKPERLIYKSFPLDASLTAHLFDLLHRRGSALFSSSNRKYLMI